MKSIPAIAMLLAMGAGCLAQERVERTARADTKLLSDALPGQLAQFLQRAGSDRALRGVSPEELHNLSAKDADLNLVIKTLAPTALLASRGAVVLGEVVTSTGLAQRAKGRTLLVAGSRVLLTDGTVVEPGGELSLGDSVENGLVLNAGETEVVLKSEITQGSFFPGEALLIGCAPACSVTCSSGYYSCCSGANGCAVCGCAANGSGIKCAAGGPGATACSITARDKDLVPLFQPGDDY